jgi:hypothetical protein
MAVNEKNLENQKRRLRFRRLADYFFRFSCFFQSGQKHRKDFPFLWFVSFGKAKEMNNFFDKRNDLY